MTAACDRLHPFSDGELSAADAAAFRDHLAGCEACASALHDRMMLEALEQTHAGSLVSARPERTDVRSKVSSIGPARAKRRRALGLVALMLPLAAAAAWTVRVALAPDAPEHVASVAPVLEVAPTRSLEVRLAYAGADRHRPYDVARSAGRASEAVPLSALAVLETKGDVHGVSAGLALSGDLARAAEYLDRAGDSLDVQADRAALVLASGKAGESLAALDAVLAKNPSHAQALFNRGIALRELGLPRSAGEAFDRAAALDEPGWSDEARARAAALHAQGEARAKAVRDAMSGGKAMVAGGPILDDTITRATPDLARHFLYQARRAAPSRERVLALRPLAEALDARAGGHRLADAIDRTAARDLVRRAPLAATYARLVASRDALDADGKRAYLAALRAAGESDLLLGAIQLAGAEDSDVDEYERLAKASGDPWFIAMAGRARGRAEAAGGDFARAEETLRRVAKECAPAHVDYRCGFVVDSLAGLLRQVGRTTDARVAALEGLASARALSADVEANALFRIGDLARAENDEPLHRAYMREAELAATGDCGMARAVHEELATAHVLAFEVDAAVAELAKVPRCGDAITLVEADAMVDAIRMKGAPAAAATLARDLEVARASVAADERAFADVVEARLRFVKDPPAGEALARRALEEASRPPVSETARKAETYARLTLAIGAAEGGRADDAFAEIAKATGSSDAAGACALAIAVDNDRALAVTRDASGVAAAELTALAYPELTAAQAVPPSSRARLASCPSVRVLAMAPLHGIPALLPADVAWGYVSRSLEAALPGRKARGRRVVVSDVTPPGSLGLAPLAGWSAPPSDASPSDVIWLHGPSATPSRVLAELGDATEIEIHAHGFVDASQSAASLVALSPDADGRYALTANDLLSQHLHGGPVVVLGACHAARTRGYPREAWSLPTAFVRAGARAVFASPSVIRDAEAGAFFDAVLARVRAGSSPAIALRDERVTWLARDASSWVKDVIDFE